MVLESRGSDAVIAIPTHVAALRQRLASRRFGMLFVNAGVKNADRETIADVPAGEFVRVIVTNALSSTRVTEALQQPVAPIGAIGVMSSGRRSGANHENGRVSPSVWTVADEERRTVPEPIAPAPPDWGETRIDATEAAGASMQADLAPGRGPVIVKRRNGITIARECHEGPGALVAADGVWFYALARPPTMSPSAAADDGDDPGITAGSIWFRQYPASANPAGRTSYPRAGCSRFRRCQRFDASWEDQDIARSGGS